MLKSLITYITWILCLLAYIMLWSAHTNTNPRETVACERVVTDNKAGIILDSSLNTDVRLDKLLTVF